MRNQLSKRNQLLKRGARANRVNSETYTFPKTLETSDQRNQHSMTRTTHLNFLTGPFGLI